MSTLEYTPKKAIAECSLDRVILSLKYLAECFLKQHMRLYPMVVPLKNGFQDVPFEDSRIKFSRYH